MNLKEFRVMIFVVCSIFLLSYWSELTGAQMYVDYWRPSGRFGKRGHKDQREMSGRMQGEKLKDNSIKESIGSHGNRAPSSWRSKRLKTLHNLKQLYDAYEY